MARPQGDADAPRDRADLSATLGVEFDATLLELALTHRSYAYENGGLAHNERLEFLGDSILGQAVTVMLYTEHPDLDEGELAKRRASLVSSVALAEIAVGIDLGAHLLLGRGEELTGGRQKSSILADCVEALIGAVYLEKGFDVAGDVVHRLFDELMAASAQLGAGLDWKTSLQELVAQLGVGAPEYVISESGPDHAKTFEARVRIAGESYGHGVGRSKKEAEQQAAETAWKALRAKHPSETDEAD